MGKLLSGKTFEVRTENEYHMVQKFDGENLDKLAFDK